VTWADVSASHSHEENTVPYSASEARARHPRLHTSIHVPACQPCTESNAPLEGESKLAFQEQRGVFYAKKNGHTTPIKVQTPFPQLK
jgi:hypothetical protein